MLKRRQQGKKRNGRMWSVLLSATLAVTTCVTVPAAVNVAEADSSELADPRVKMNECDTVYFGSYLQEDTNGDGIVNEEDEKEPILWRILWQNEEGTDAYVIADKVLDCQQYNRDHADVTWEDCSLREWLNKDFYNTAFTEEEQNVIIEQTLVNEDNEEYGTSGGNDTEDKVYLPSLSDMKNTSYNFSDDDSFDDQARIGKATSYAKEQGVETNEEMGSWWWLRSPGRTMSLASNVHSEGEVSISGYGVRYTPGGVRPALHLNLSSPLVTKWKKMKVSLKSAEWDTVELGTYEGRAITWRVLSVSEQDVFLLSEQILTNKIYHDTNKDVTWENSTLRNWLNTEFYKEAFNDEERKGIVGTDYTNADNPWYETDGGVKTKDYVGLLSLEDIVKEEYGFPTEYYCEHPSRIAYDEFWYSIGGRFGSWWWLCSPGYIMSDISNVYYFGDSLYGRVLYTYSKGVRPALHFNPSFYPLAKAGTVKAVVGEELSVPATPEEPTGESTDKTVAATGASTNKTEEATANKNGSTGTHSPTVTTGTTTRKKDKPTTFNIKNKKTYRKSKKVKIKDLDGIRQIKLNKKKIKVGGKKSYSFKLSKYKKYLKKKGKWNKLVVTDKNGKKKSIKFKTK